jgi:hypothetical protein
LEKLAHKVISQSPMIVVKIKKLTANRRTGPTPRDKLGVLLIAGSNRKGRQLMNLETKLSHDAETRLPNEVELLLR